MHGVQRGRWLRRTCYNQREHHVWQVVVDLFICITVCASLPLPPTPNSPTPIQLNLLFREWDEEWFNVVMKSVGLDADVAAMPIGLLTVSASAL